MEVSSNTNIVNGQDETIAPTTPAPVASAMAPASEWIPTGKPSPRVRRLRVRLGIAAAIIALYAIGIFYFSSHFVPGTTVDGIDAGLLSVEQLADALDKRAATYQLKVSDAHGFAATFVGADFGLASDGTAVAEEAHDRTFPLFWLPHCLAAPHMLIDAQVRFDDEALASLVSQAVEAYNAEAEAPTSAKASYDADAGQFVVVDEVLGTQLDATKVHDICARACRDLSLEATIDDGALLRPRLTRLSKELLSTVGSANARLAQPIAMTCGDDTVCTVDAPTMAGFISINGDPKLVVDGSAVYAYVEKSEALQDAGNTYDEEHVWALDIDGTADALVQALQSDSAPTAEVARELIETKPAATPGARERGRHIDVNLSTQFARFYDTDGKVIWESYFVSGNLAEGRSTPTGEFAIEAKVNGTTLVGADENGDGEPDYESYVSYWMPFLAGDWGLHDATWRWDGEFGGTTYTWNGSHGCINLPYYSAEQLFYLCEVGDPVIVHW